MNAIRPADNLIVSPAELQARLYAARRPRPAIAARLVATLELWWLRYRERKAMRRDLPTFPPEVLEDFGLTRAEAEKQAKLPFWKA
ncbi:DUF1127 domain-containing protein [Rhizobium sp. RU36D]|uniref:DUF1127 domain-containing protein n=1 Tax=Rhizobium sp. RU36D TaxID=1907415 RepID=UPI0009D8A3AD|nr:DUF1127 domain-containing protein [Rhizobium sp. RU36D]SMD19566.1 protein of unknown function [Rhizobium sp. RU36D]